MEEVMNEELTFGVALEALKDGMKIARKGWNGKGMFLFLVQGGVPNGVCVDIDSNVSGEELVGQNINDVARIDGVPLSLFERIEEGASTRLPCIGMSTASGATLNGWLASQTDMLATDWEIVE